MSLETIVATYGYPALFIGTFLEGETILVVAGYMAYRGYLELPWVIFWAFLGSCGGDQFFFYLGRTQGRKLLARHAKWQPRAARVRSMLNRFELPVVLGFRFLWGVRNITPLVIGASGYSPWRFAVLNVIGAIVWAVAVAYLGYAFGHAIEGVLAKIRHYEMWILVALLTAILIVRLWWFYWARFRKETDNGAENGAADESPADKADAPPPSST